MDDRRPSDLDRRVRIEARGSEPPRDGRLSDLRDEPFVVILGEPGIGKTTALKREAEASGTKFMRVRALLNDFAPPPGNILFLDGLDEYRTDAARADMPYQLINAIEKSGRSRWRLTCRSEDWRGGADLTGIREGAGQQPLVAILEPLDADEAAGVLRSFGEGDPEVFLQKARHLGAEGFLGSPLSLLLLHKAVSGSGRWPATRFDLFSLATQKLAHEHNKQRGRAFSRPSVEQILAAASSAFLMQLCSGAVAVWRADGEPETVEGAAGVIRAADVPVDHSVLDWAIDTPLFRGEGEEFEPMHRTIAEFLAGGALAALVVGDHQHAAFPLSRALALIAPEGRAPTALRGLYAWFAAHLARLGQEASALRTIESDPYTVAAYGDAAIFSSRSRREILLHLADDDPYFRASRAGITAIGGLAGDDLALEFEAILSGQASDDRLLTAYEALMAGRPVPGLRPILRVITLDLERADWQRWRAMDAFIHSSSDPNLARRELLDEFAAQGGNDVAVGLSVQLLTELYPAQVSIAEIKRVLSAFAGGSKRRSAFGSLFRLKRRMRELPCVSLFDEPISTWLPDEIHHSREFELARLLDEVLASAIRTLGHGSAPTLWRWIRNAHSETWPEPEQETLEAIQEWLGAEDDRCVELFSQIMSGFEIDKLAWMPDAIFASVTRNKAPEAVGYFAFQNALNATDPKVAHALFELSARIAKRGGHSSLFWKLYERFEISTDKELLQDLTVCNIEDHVLSRWDRLAAQRQKAAQADQKVRDRLLKNIARIKSAKSLVDLDRLASVYFGNDSDYYSTKLSIDNIDRRYGSEIKDATREGWQNLLFGGLDKITPEALANLEMDGLRALEEYPVIAGLDLMMSEGRIVPLSTISVSVALIVLKSAFVLSDGKRQELIFEFANELIGFDPAVGADALYRYLAQCLERGRETLTEISMLRGKPTASKFLSRVLRHLLVEKPSMAKDALKACLRVAALELPPAELLNIADAALLRPDVEGVSQALWRTVAFVLDPANGFSALREDVASSDVREILVWDVWGRDTGVFHPVRGTSVLACLQLLKGLASQYPPRSVATKLQHRDAIRLIEGAIDYLASNTDEQARAALLDLVEDQSLLRWRSTLLHAQALQRRLRRDAEFRHPTPSALRAALSGGPPTNAAELRAILADELELIRRELHTADTTPWRHFWNREGGTPTSPLIENDCRDVLLHTLQERLKKYQISAALPEAQRVDATRADVLIISGAGKNLPIEAKRHFHRELWTAAVDQLGGYAADVGADGRGIYLVFWFGTDWEPTPPRLDGGLRPSSAAQLESMLRADLPADLRDLRDIVVMDVSASPEQIAKAKSKIPGRQKRDSGAVKPSGT